MENVQKNKASIKNCIPYTLFSLVVVWLEFELNVVQQLHDICRNYWVIFFSWIKKIELFKTIFKKTFQIIVVWSIGSSSQKLVKSMTYTRFAWYHILKKKYLQFAVFPKKYFTIAVTTKWRPTIRHKLTFMIVTYTFQLCSPIRT